MQNRNGENQQDKRTKRMQSLGMVIVLACICDLLWGSAFPCIKLGYQVFQISSADTATQILFAGMRFTLAGLLVILFMSLVRRRFLHPTRKKTWGRVLLLSCFQTILQYILFYIGLAHTTGVKGSIIEACNVFIAIFVASLVFHQEKLTAQKVVGSLIGFIGVVIINLQGLTLDINVGDICIFLSTFAYAMSSVLLKRYSKEEDTVVMSGYQFLMGGLVMIVIGVISGGRIHHVTTGGCFLLLYLAFISAMAYSLWAVLLSYNPISKVAVMGFLNPVFGVILSALILQEGQQAFHLRSFIALIFVCMGICIVYWRFSNSNRDNDTDKNAEGDKDMESDKFPEKSRKAENGMVIEKQGYREG